VSGLRVPWPRPGHGTHLSTVAYMTRKRTSPRRRREVNPIVLRFMAPALRYSPSRDAYVLRVVGDRWGPVVRRRERP
jgi:hypothetical protein